ncbi:polyadenylate-binding protein RBP45-like isoform X2 [Rhododendron vialii]|uniref:polyadenylate-binding protein RBP45-like isoform X1 n=2 Tax=Rhododendron vialii TaxID=182163 RepID=UPI0026601BF7|nr:polyadenylate-binding protein RBP45-like isoform X1 [Rhododendron vialii]XP_058209693.1 polyadenylate-binding protein RBP45-like isoform X2 [Rhododendron vialii]
MMQPGTGMPPPQMHQQQYQQQPPPPQQWMMMQQQQPPPQQPQQGYQPPPPQQFWPQQPPPQAAAPPMQMQQQQFSAEQMGGSNEIKSLWIGDLQGWMEENYLYSCFAQTGELTSVKVIRNKQSGQPEGYGFLEFKSRATAETVLQTYNGSLMPNSEQPFRLNWATLGAGERRADDGPDYTIFVGDLAADVTDYLLLETFKPHYTSIKGAKVVTDRMTGRTKGYGFVRFGDESEQLRAMSEMNGVHCSSRPMRIGPAATKKPASVQPYQKATYQNSQANPGENDPTNTTIFVGGLEENVSDDLLRQVFGQFGELVHVKIPAGKRCGFVQFADRACAEQALSVLNGTQIGGTNVRLSWGRSPNKQAQTDQTQWNNGGYYGYAAQGYEAYGYAPPPAQDPNAYYGGYPGYGSYQQPQQ